MDSLRLDSWVLGWNIQRPFSSSLNRRGKGRQGKGREGKVVYMTYTIFSKIPMMTDDDDDDDEKRREEENS